LLKLGENTKSALREELGKINKETLKDLRDIKNANEKVANLLLEQGRRLGRVEGSLELIRQLLP
jgi:flagellar motility protein MotE (MotC chaperone)